MHIRRSLMVVAVALAGSIAGQPLHAGRIVIDSFTNPTSPNPLSGSSSAVSDGTTLVVADSPSTAGAPSGSVFSDRAFFADFGQSGGTGRTAQTFSSSFLTTPGSGGSLQWTDSKPLGSGTAYGSLTLSSSLLFSRAGSIDFTAGGNDSIRFEKSAGSRVGPGVLVDLYLQGGWNGSTTTTSAEVPINSSAWFSSTPLEIPFASFTLGTGFSFTDVSSMQVVLQYVNGSSNNALRIAAYNSSVTLTEIALVPEPAPLACVAAGVASLGAWRLRRSRAARRGAARREPGVQPVGSRDG